MKLASPVVVYLRAFVFITSLRCCYFRSSAAGQLRLVEYAAGFSRPLGMVQDPLDPSVQYVLEKFGTIWTLKNGVRQAEPFIDLSEVVMEDSNGERGLLGLASSRPMRRRRDAPSSSSRRRTAGAIPSWRASRGSPAIRCGSIRRHASTSNSRPAQRYIAQPDDIHQSRQAGLRPRRLSLHRRRRRRSDLGSGQHAAQSPDELLGKILRIDVNVPDARSRRLRRAARQSVRRHARRAARDLGARPAQSVAIQCRQSGARRHRRARHRGRGTGRLGGSELSAGRRRRPQLRLERARRQARSREA